MKDFSIHSINFIIRHLMMVNDVVTMAEEITDFDKRLFEFLKKGDYEKTPWSTPVAAKELGVEEKEIYESLCRLQKHMKGHVYIYYRDGALRIQAE